MTDNDTRSESESKIELRPTTRGIRLRRRLALWIGTPLYLMVSSVTVVPSEQRNQAIASLVLLGVVVYGIIAWVYEFYLCKRCDRIEAEKKSDRR